jgi:3'-phosphoadenosine 5'-phosphosulfate sulfotransferase (PAPS reductase)/FAD synthetase
LQTVNYCGLSGGKDSTATALWLIHESGESLDSMRFTFCDTGNEHDFVYQHIEMLSRRFVEWGCSPILTLKPERDFLELAKWKKRFPSRKARFCTQFLKVIPTREDVTALIRADFDVVLHSGVRAGESDLRSKLVERGFDDMFGCTVNRPLLRKSLADVIAIHERYKVPLNPLYSFGFSRVGCFPCINSNKREVKLISIHFPKRIDEIRQQERAGFGPGGRYQSFFHARTVPNRFHSETYINRKGVKYSVATIDDVVRWSHTGKRAREKQPVLFEDFYDDDKTLVCPSGRGMCE